MFLGIVGLNVQPKSIHTRSLETIQVLRCEAVPIGFNQNPKVGLGFDESCTFLVKRGTAGNIPTCEGDYVPCRTEALWTEQNGLWFEGTRTGIRPISMRDAAPATSACLLRMPGGRPFPGLLKVHQRFVFHAFFQDIPRCIPGAILYFAEIPGVTFSAGKIAPGLIYGKIVFRS